MAAIIHSPNNSIPISLLPVQPFNLHSLFSCNLSLTTTKKTKYKHHKPSLFLQNPSKSHFIQPLLTPQQFKDSNVSVDSETNRIDYANLLRISVRCGDVELTKIIHSSILKLEEEDVYLKNALIAAYVKLGHLNLAERVFDLLLSPDVVSYTAIISAFAKSNCQREAFELFLEMRELGIEPNEFTYVAILTACIRSLNLELGCQIHGLVIRLGYSSYTYVVNALMGLYSKCGLLEFVVLLFNDMPQKDIVSWNTVIACMVEESMYDRAFEMYRELRRNECLIADHFTVSTLLAASSRCLAVREGQELHRHALKSGLHGNLSVNNALIGFYTKCGTLKNVVDVFERMPVKDVFSWTEMVVAYMEFGHVDLAMEIFNSMPDRNSVSYNALLAGFIQNNEGFKALALFCRMLEGRMELDDFTLTSVLNACGSMTNRKVSEQIHAFILKLGLKSNDCIDSALVDMCTQCGRMDDAKKIFHELPLDHDNSIALTSIISAYARNGQPEEAISLFVVGHSEESLVVDEVALATILGVCGTLGIQKFGEQIHCYAWKHGLMSDTGVGNATISMYSKCGEMRSAINTFEAMPTHDLVSWNGLLTCFVLRRQGDGALDTWTKMEKLRVKPDSITCLLVISAYRHTSRNLVDGCQKFFSSMQSSYNVNPTSEHYAGFVGVLGYWDLLEEAEKIISAMPFEPKASVWHALLEGCRIHANAIIGKRVMKNILSIVPQDPSTFILKSNLYSASGRWQCSEVVRAEMREKGLRKIPARSWIIFGDKVHSFFARDKLHSQSKDIYSGLQILIMECLKAGYVPDTSFVLHEVEEHQKKDFLFYHSAKLAVTFGLLMTRPGRPVRVMKNVLLCGDCHTFFKYVSVVTKRDIHVRDASGFHHFVNGKCSCRDNWC
ncbi:pentatricopeptide repeat-containing protein At5g03800 [Lycium ferocissimum]|uniref:pentatricopeptide repeat-containing protein At5g03800 n=1 Tax=Lycium ferocissimum TaxID=112874 RepID=UPI0028159ED7|nr:pentatricopeptide repeat-containing protein At5g03800 [Lycium ferocissimum]